MQKLDNRHLEAAFSYLRLEPEFNLFLIGDLEAYGMEHENVSCYTDDDWKSDMEFPYFILNYRGNVLVYSRDETYDAEKVADFLNEMDPENISGKDDIVKRLVPYLKDRISKPMYLARLNQIGTEEKEKYGDMMKQVQRLGEKDIPAAYDLYLTIDEFAYTYRRKEKEKCYEDIRQNISVIGRTYGIFEGDVLAAVVQTSAENTTSAMVVGVATRPEMRGKGYAKAAILKLCQDCLEEMDFLCLFFENPVAGRIYHAVGFKDMGMFTMIRKREA